MSKPKLLGQSRLTWMAIVLIFFTLLTLFMLFWENINLIKTTTSQINEQTNLLFQQLEINGHPIQHVHKLQAIATNKLKSDAISSLNNSKLKPAAITSSTSNPKHHNTQPIYDNPMNHPHCQNALIDKENIDKEQLLAQYASKISCQKTRSAKLNRNKQQRWLPHIWSREFISALTSNDCFEPRTPVRTIKNFYNERHFLNKKNNIPVFYHIPKCGSSSTAAMTSELFNFTIHWQLGPERMHEAIRTQCGFAFIRDPIQRFISAYYTINKKIYREMQHEFVSAIDRIPERYKDSLTFLSVMGEPQRFRTFMDDLFKAPHLWGLDDPLKHISSQSYFLSNWFGSDINFLGRVEHYGEHWSLLMNHKGCEWFKDLYKDTDLDLEHYEVSHALFHYGTMGISLYNSRGSRQKEYIEALGMGGMLEKMYGKDKRKYNLSEDDVLPPAYYFITEQMYSEIVEFYYQDFVCFGYKPDYAEFRNYVESKKNPFTMTL